MRCMASVCCCTAGNCWAQPSTASPPRPAWEMGASRKCTLSTSLISTRLNQRWTYWTTRADIAFPRDCVVTPVARKGEVSQRAQLLHQPRVGSTLVHLLKPWLVNFAGLPWHAGQRQLGPQHHKPWQRERPTAYRPWTGDADYSSSGGVLRTQVHRNRTLLLGNVDAHPSCPTIEGSEDGGRKRAASGRKKGPSTTTSLPHAHPGRKEPEQNAVVSRALHREPIGQL